MSTIFKLSIQGIRSFDAGDRQTIQFGSPLTLIAGQNGTGKTTIIECLRYATTGDLPPNSKGGAFIHDAKFSGDKEVFAQVKLAFYNVNRVQMVCTRSLLLQLKRTQRSVKTLEGQLLALKDGKRTTINTRCADLDKEMPIYLGTSKAILDYVIFCHQEDSLWPLAEASVVKKRFDEIFEATKFTKALDNIKTLRKEYTQEIKLKEKDVYHLKSEKERAEKAEQKIEALATSRTALEEKTETTKMQLSKIRTEAKELFETNQKFQAILYQLESTRKELDRNVENLDRVSQGLELMQDTEDQLCERLANFESTTSQLVDNRDRAVKQVDDTKSQADELRDQFSDFARQIGQLQSEYDVYRKNLDKRSKYGEECAQELGVRFSVDSFQSSLLQLKETVSRELEAARTRRAQEEAQCNEQLQEVKAQGLAKNDRKRAAQKEIKDNEKQLKKLEEEIDSMHVDEGVVAEEQTNLREMGSRLTAIKQQIVESKVVERHQTLSEEVERVENEAEALNVELAEVNKRSNDKARLGFMKEEYQRKQAALEALINGHRDEFSEANIDAEGADVEKQARTMHSDCQDAVDAAVHRLDALRREKSQTETRLKILDKDVSRHKATVAEKRQLLSSMVDASVLAEFDDELSRVEKDVAEITADIGTAKFTERYYAKAKELAECSDAKCLLCDRKFDDTKMETQDFVARIQANTEQLPSRLVHLKEDLAENSEYLSRLRSAKPLMNQLNEVEQQLPQLVEEQEQLRQTLQAETRSLEEQERNLTAAKRKVAQMEKLRKVSGDIMRVRREVEAISDRINSSESLLTQTGLRSSDDIYDDLGKVRQIVKEKKSQLRALTEEKSSLLAQQSSLESLSVDKKIEVNKLENLLSDKRSKEQQMKSVQVKVEQLEQEIDDINQALESLITEIEQKEQFSKETVATHAAIETKLSSQLTRISSITTQWQGLEDAIEQFTKQNGQQRLEEALAKQQDVAANLERLKETLIESERALSDAEKALVDVRGQERQLKDNLEVRRIQREIQTNKQLVAELEAKNAIHDKEQYDKKSAQLSDQQAALNSEYSSMAGEIKQINDQIEQLQQELDTEFLNVKQDYAKNLVTLQTTTIANSDLAKYGQALDNAIMKYHAMKMEEINRIIDELWKKTYTGSDIDSIIIRSEHESTRANRTYNYRVCMIKQDVELDMRGRCSAGQKVLACLIVRLALSECFGTKCGLIALDEPTTNLDKQNSESLARSLAAIISMRRNQKNFQLIVITHDEHFLSHMNAAQITDHYFRVSRNSNQKSQIHCLPAQ